MEDEEQKESVMDGREREGEDGGAGGSEEGAGGR